MLSRPCPANLPRVQPAMRRSAAADQWPVRLPGAAAGNDVTHVAPTSHPNAFRPNAMKPGSGISGQPG